MNENGKVYLVVRVASREEFEVKLDTQKIINDEATRKEVGI